MFSSAIAPATSSSSSPLASPLPQINGLWRASELASFHTSTCRTGHPQLDKELPNQGWPRSVLVEMLLQQAGIGEMQLLKPVLAELSRKRQLVFINPPYLPYAMTCQAWQIKAQHLLCLRPSSSADALWAAEQVLRSGCCAALLLWQSNIRSEALRRLHLLAQSSDTWIWLLRPLANQLDTSPAALRLALRSAPQGIQLEIIKRRGPPCDVPLLIPLADMPGSQPLIEPSHEITPLPASIAVSHRSSASVLV